MKPKTKIKGYAVYCTRPDSEGIVWTDFHPQLVNVFIPMITQFEDEAKQRVEDAKKKTGHDDWKVVPCTIILTPNRVSKKKC